ncbi:exodeoxyribonuclease V subunit alpha [Jeongeupia chitinilytica]|uniref:RecBCD enzyme subunit RecD n=1 Tax=Jeongeupia chitinilytica TaxID=1041641 RepID=A0ABQ3H058_9NEIS|nr:exodeoxyribonuclease V subunit alpha [Jeongeupia chitinilytica]GHD63701.1 RecBCD enzyme subunit RecD [Jeongeupia chitinilytica]
MMPQSEMLALLARWAERGWLRELDRAFAAFLADEAPDASSLLLLGAALASHQLGRGHVCLDLQATLADSSFVLSLPPDGEDEAGLMLPSAVLAGIDLAAWQAALQQPVLTGDGPGASPLVLAGARLYLRRYWQYEVDVRAAIEARLARTAEQRAGLPPAALKQALDALFPPTQHPGADWQKLACALAAGNGFSIITGGPGTGKTTTVVRLLALLQSLALRGDDERPLRIRLAAPTGKAAARLGESIAGAVRQLPLDGLSDGEAIRAAIPVEVTTLHRLLGSKPDSRHFRHDATHPLALDLLVIDEASMIDLEMMAAVLAALPSNARLILLGDKDQLASVEAGAVLGELCQRAREGHYWPATRDWLAAASGEHIDASLIDADGTALDQAVVMLRHSHRFSAASGIGQLAEAVNAGDADAVQAVWAHGYGDLARVELGADDAALRELVIDGAVARFRTDESKAAPSGYRHYLQVMAAQHPAATADQSVFDDWAKAVLAAHGRFQLLCALRRGPWGVERLNQRIAELLHAEGLLPAHQGWYAGRPVLVTRNDYGLGLMNGDIGMTLPAAGEDGTKLRVAFPAGDGRIKWVLPSRLQAVETVFAMTVHKSQGSEFSHAALLLPDRLNPVLTRELVYTGITRARHWFTLASAGPDWQVLKPAILRRVQRASGLLAD